MKKRGKSQDNIVFDPPTRITGDGRCIRIYIDLPGVTEEQIRIDLEKTTFTLSISDNEKTFRKTIHVPEEVRLFKKKFSLGVLEIFLEKTVP